MAAAVHPHRIDLIGDSRLSDGAALEDWRRRFSEKILPVDVEPLARGRLVARVGVLADRQVLVAHYNISPISMSRGSDLVSTRNECVTLSYVVDGTFNASQNGSIISVTAGAAVTLVTDRPSVLETPTGGAFIGVRVPKPLLEARGIDPDRLAGFFLSRRSPGLRLFRAYVDQLRREDDIPAAMRPMVAGHLVDLLAASLLPALQTDENGDVRTGLREGRRARVREILETRYADPDLDVETVAREAGLSVRSLQGLFQEEGTSFSDRLRDLRLAHAYALLTGPLGSSTIADIAFAVGFRDVTTFNRAFRRRYDTNPAAVREGGR